MQRYLSWYVRWQQGICQCQHACDLDHKTLDHRRFQVDPRQSSVVFE